MKVTTKITYNAAKLAKAMPRMIENYIQASGESTIEASRKRIDTINYISHDNSHKKMPKLSDRTIALRAKNKLEGKSYGANSFGDTPLKYTGNFYNSMEATKKGVKMLKYGWHHNIGKSDSILRPKREFFEFKASKKSDQNFEKELTKNFRK
tara:strand:- start:36 stop:491 length:456 start_codon:yes stop_codon:yes gene_type:complete